jgi:hypothetical protein
LVLFKDIEASGFLKLNEGVIKEKNPGKCRQRTETFDSGREFYRNDKYKQG